MATSAALTAAAVLTLFTAVVHATLGTRDVLKPMLAASLPRTVIHVMEALWHMLTLHLLLLGAAFAWAARAPHAPFAPLLALFGGATALVYAVVFFALSVARFGDARRLPQWLLFAPIAGLALASNVELPSVGAWLGDSAAIGAALVLLGVGSLHVLWAVGLPWPLASRDQLALTVVGDDNLRMPGRAPTLIVALLLVFSAVWLLALRGFGPVRPAGPLSSWVTWAMCAVFALRGIGGYFEAALRPSVIGTPYLRLSLRLYSPLCGALALAIAVAAR